MTASAQASKGIFTTSFNAFYLDLQGERDKLLGFGHVTGLSSGIVYYHVFGICQKLIQNLAM
jgi:hypothetical protein